MDTSLEPFRSIDEWVYRHPTRPARGFHDDHERGPSYAPAIQQVRSEWFGFLEACERQGLAGGSAVEIGLGMHGGTHYSLTRLFGKTVTVEVQDELIARYREHNIVEEARESFVAGLSTERSVLDAVRARLDGGTCDVLFIDGGHQFDEVREDWIHWRHIVRPGGMIAFHDSVKRDNPEAVNVHRFLQWLETEHGITTRRIGDELGIAFYIQTASEEAALPCRDHHGNFSIYPTTTPGMPCFVGVDTTEMPVRACDVVAGSFPMVLVDDNLDRLRSHIDLFSQVRPTLDHARTLLASGDVDQARLTVTRIREHAATLPDILEQAVAVADRASELLAYSAILGITNTTSWIPRLRRSSARDPMNEEKLWLLAHSVQSASTDDSTPGLSRELAVAIPR